MDRLDDLAEDIRLLSQKGSNKRQEIRNLLVTIQFQLSQEQSCPCLRQKRVATGSPTSPLPATEEEAKGNWSSDPNPPEPCQTSEWTDMRRGEHEESHGRDSETDHPPSTSGETSSGVTAPTGPTALMEQSELRKGLQQYSNIPISRCPLHKLLRTTDWHDSLEPCVPPAQLSCSFQRRFRRPTFSSILEDSSGKGEE
jgi:hypothetical protein